ncbi:MAG: ABC transporter permease subunit, partial [Pseudomonadota bacterium]
MEQLAEQFFNLEIALQVWPLMLRGLGMTLMLCAIIIPLGIFGGLLAAIAATSNSHALRIFTRVYADFFRAIPPLVLLIFVYSALPFAGINLSPLAAVVIAFVLNNSSFYGEIFRAGIQSIGEGQWHAARATGLNLAQT